MKDNNLEYVIGKLVENKKAPKETLFQARYCGYDLSDRSLEPEANVSKTKCVMR